MTQSIDKALSSPSLLTRLSTNKTALCLLIVTIFTAFFFARSIVVRERWIQPTFIEWQNYYQKHRDVTARKLSFVNHWLNEGAFHLRFGLYSYFASVEMPTLAKRNPYTSFPPGAILPIYVLFKTLDAIGVVPNIHEKKGIQILMITAYNYLTHFLLTLILCFLVFFMCLKLGFDRLNSIIFASVPTIVQLHNANSLYHHHAIYVMDTAVLLPLVLYGFLEFLRTTYASQCVLRWVKVLQPLAMFWSVLTAWLSVFVIVAVYTVRLIRREIRLPTTQQEGLHWLRQSFLFFSPAFAALGVWIYQITPHLQDTTHVSSLAEAGVTGKEVPIFSRLWAKMGFADGIAYYIEYLKTAFITHIQDGYGLIGIIMIYMTLYISIRGRKFMGTSNHSIRQATTIYIILLVPCLIYNLFFLQHVAVHIYSSLKFSLALSFAFVLFPVFILQMGRKNHLLPAGKIGNTTRTISLAAVIAFSSSVLYAHTQIYGEEPITKMFSQPNYTYPVIGNFVKKNTDYKDVVFSNFYYDPFGYITIRSYFSNKVVHRAHNLDHVYHKIKPIVQDFTVKILYHIQDKQEAEKIISFLALNNISVDNLHEERIGGLLTFDGGEFRAWYERSEKAANKPTQHECDVHPQRCEVGKMVLP